MEQKEYVTLDFSECKYISEIYQQMREKMNWDDWYGENLYAVWDILTGLPHYGNDFTIIRPLHYQNIPHGQDKQFESYINKLCDTFMDAYREGYLNLRIEYC